MTRRLGAQVSLSGPSWETLWSVTDSVSAHFILISETFPSPAAVPALKCETAAAAFCSPPLTQCKDPQQGWGGWCRAGIEHHFSVCAAITVKAAELSSRFQLAAEEVSDFMVPSLDSAGWWCFIWAIVRRPPPHPPPQTVDELQYPSLTTPVTSRSCLQAPSWRSLPTNTNQDVDHDTQFTAKA